MYIIKKEIENKKISLREQLNTEIKSIARKRLIEKDLSPTARKILEDILLGKHWRNEAS
jgi:hypothetical protein